MGIYCSQECVNDFKDNILDKFGSSNPYMVPTSTIDIPKTTPEETKTIEETMTTSKIIGKSSGNPKDLYSFKDKITETPTGAIYLIEKKDNKELRTIKSLKKKENNIINIELLKKDIDNLKLLSHTNILQLYEVYDNNKYLSYVTEYCAGGSLSKNIKHFKKYSEIYIACIMYQIFDALNYAHKNNIIHTCLNPDYILLKNKLKKGYPDIKIYGFGLAKLYINNKNKVYDYSPNYIAPEIFSNQTDPKSDIWSCGVLLYVLLTGKFPFKGETFEQLKQNIIQGKLLLNDYYINKASAHVKNILSKLLKLNINERISAEQALEDEWFKSLNIREKLSDLNINLIQEVIEQIGKFKLTNKLQIPILDFFITKALSEEETKFGAHLFTILDTNNDGEISKEEFIHKITEIYEESNQKISKEKLGNLYKIFLFDKLEKVTYKNFSIVICNRNNVLHEEYLEKAFLCLDKDKNKLLSFYDLEFALKKDKYYDSKKLEEIFTKSDSNYDGNIDYNEFKKMIADILLD